MLHKTSWIRYFIKIILCYCLAFLPLHQTVYAQSPIKPKLTEQELLIEDFFSTLFWDSKPTNLGELLYRTRHFMPIQVYDRLISDFKENLATPPPPLKISHNKIIFQDKNQSLVIEIINSKKIFAKLNEIEFSHDDFNNLDHFYKKYETLFKSKEVLLDQFLFPRANAVLPAGLLLGGGIALAGIAIAFAIYFLANSLTKSSENLSELEATVGVKEGTGAQITDEVIEKIKDEIDKVDEESDSSNDTTPSEKVSPSTR